MSASAHGVVLEGFEGFLRQRQLAKEGHILHLVRWVERFLDLYGAEGSYPRDVLLRFRGELEQVPCLAAWQLQQAEDAVRLYGQYLRAVRSQAEARRRPAGASAPLSSRRPEAPPQGGVAAVPRAAGSASAAAPGTPPWTWLEAREELTVRLRLKHYSYHTEQAYLAWAERPEIPVQVIPILWAAVGRRRRAIRAGAC